MLLANSYSFARKHPPSDYRRPRSSRHASPPGSPPAGKTQNEHSPCSRPAARITTFALEAYLHQLRQDGYSVFVVRGNDLPPPATEPREGSRDSWYRVKDLLEVSKGGEYKYSSRCS